MEGAREGVPSNILTPAEMSETSGETSRSPLKRSSSPLKQWPPGKMSPSTKGRQGGAQRNLLRENTLRQGTFVTPEGSIIRVDRDEDKIRVGFDHDGDGMLDDEIMLTDEVHERLARVQRTFREIQFAFKNFAPQFFVDSHGEVSNGRINFCQGPSDGVKPAPWISVAPTACLTRMRYLIDRYWKLPKPEVLITVTGGAQDFNLNARLQEAFDVGMVGVAASANGWVFSAGTDSGVMRLVGNAMARYNVKVPVLAVLPWGVCNGRDALRKERGKTANYEGGKASREGAPLNAHHTHFIFVDNGKEGGAAWGAEIIFRAELESHLAQKKRVPIVQLVVQGGPGTVATVEATARRGNPIVLLVDSGGAATAIHQYCMGGIEAVDNPAFKSQEDRLRVIKEANDAYDKQLVTFFSLEGEDAAKGDMSESLLEAILKMQAFESAVRRGRNSAANASPETRLGVSEPSPAKGEAVPVSKAVSLGRLLILTVNWNQPRLARKILAQLGADKEDASSEIMTIVQAAMSKALELKRGEIFTLFLKLPAMSTERISMGQLYWLGIETNEFLRSNRVIKKRLRLCASSGPADLTEEGANGTRPFLQEYEIYKWILSPAFSELHPILFSVLEANDRTRPHDIFLWFVSKGDEKLARMIWPFCDLPIHMALLGVILARSLSEKRQMYQMKSKFVELAANLETWACGALSMAEDEHYAHTVLSVQFPRKRACTALDLACIGKSKHFLNHDRCISLMERWWRGGVNAKYELESDFSWWALLLWAFCPILNPVLYRDDPSANRSQQNKHTFHSITNSVLFTLASSKDELSRAQSFAQAEAEKSGNMDMMKRLTKQRTMHEFSHVVQSKEMEVTQEGDKSWVDKHLGFVEFYRIPAVKFLFRILIHMCACLIYALLVFSFVPHFELDGDCPYQSWASGGWVDNSRCEQNASMCPHCCADGATSCTVASTGISQLSRARHSRLSSDPRDPDYSSTFISEVWLMRLWLVFQLGMWLDARHKSVRMSILGAREQAGLSGHIWALLDYLVIAASLVLLLMDITSRMEDSVSYDWVRFMYALFQVFVSVNVILYFILILQFLSVLSQDLGEIIIMLPHMISDVMIFVKIIIILTPALSICFCGFVAIGYIDPYNGIQVIADYIGFDGALDPDYSSLNGTGGMTGTRQETLTSRHERNLFGVRGAMWAPFWATFGFFDPQDLSSHLSYGDVLTTLLSTLPSLFMYIWLLIANVLMVNLLVAMFSDTFSRIKDASELEYRFLKYNMIFECMHVHPVLPQVTNIPIVTSSLAQFVYQGGNFQNGRSFPWTRAKMRGVHKFFKRRVPKQSGLEGSFDSMTKLTGSMKKLLGISKRPLSLVHSVEPNITKYFFPGGSNRSRSRPSLEISTYKHPDNSKLFNFEQFRHKMQDGRLLVESFIQAEFSRTYNSLEAITHDLRKKIDVAHMDRKEHANSVQGTLKEIQAQLEALAARMPPQKQ